MEDPASHTTQSRTAESDNNPTYENAPEEQVAQLLSAELPTLADISLSNLEGLKHRLGQKSYEELMELSVELSKAQVELERKRFIDQSLARFNEIMRLHVDSTLQSWADGVLMELVPFLDGLQAALYMVEEQEEKLVRIGGYALPEDALEELEIGQGLTGQVVKTGRTVHYQSPEYFSAHTESSLSKVQAQTILVLPLKLNDQVEGVLELTALESFARERLEFLHSLSDDIATNLVTLRNQVKIRHLLQDAQEQREQLQAQEEEMRQNVEELEATQEEMQRAQRSLQESEQNLKDLLDNIPSGIFVLQADGTPFYANISANIIMGLPEKELPKVTPGEMPTYFNAKKAGSDEDYPAELNPLTRALAGAACMVDDLEIELDGQRTPLEIIASPVYNADEELQYAIATFRDISQRKAWEQELQQKNEELASREEELRQNLEELEATQDQMRAAQQRAIQQRNIMDAILDSSDSSIIAVDTDLRILTVNELVRKNYAEGGLEITEGEPILNFLPADQADYYRDVYRRALKGQRFTEEFSFSDEGGEDRLVEVTYYPILGDQEETLGAASVARDVTRQRRQQTRLEKMNREFALKNQLVQKAPVALGFGKLEDGNFMDVNQAYAELFGLAAPEEMIGTGPLHYAPETQPDGTPSSQAIKAHLTEAVENQTHQFEFRHQRPDGTCFDAEVVLAVIDYEGQQYLYSSVEDITLRKEQEELRNQNEQLKSTEERFRRMGTNLPGMLFQYQLFPESGEHGFRFVSQRANDLFGLAPEKLAGVFSTEPSLKLHPEDEASFFSAFTQSAESLEAFNWQGRIFNRNDQNYKIIRVRSVPTTEADGTLVWDGYMEDITQDEHMRQELANSREELDRVNRELHRREQALQKSTAVAEFDPAGNILSVNDNFCQLMGYTPVELKGKHHRIFVDKAYAESEAYANFWKKLSNGEFFTETFTRYKKNGDTVQLQAAYSPVLGNDGKPEKVVKFAIAAPNETKNTLPETDNA